MFRFVHLIIQMDLIVGWYSFILQFLLVEKYFPDKALLQAYYTKRSLKGVYWNHHVWLVAWFLEWLVCLWGKYTPQLMKN